MLLIQHTQSQTSIPLFLSICLLILECLLILDYSYSLCFLKNKLTKNAPDKNTPIQNAVINVVLNSISIILFFQLINRSSALTIQDYKKRNQRKKIQKSVPNTINDNRDQKIVSPSPNQMTKLGIRFQSKVPLRSIIVRLINK